MNMIRHYYPRPEVVAFGPEKPNGDIHCLRNVFAAQVRFTSALVKIRFKSRSAFSFVFDLQKMLPLGL